MDYHVRDRHHDELAAGHGTKRSLDDFFKVNFLERRKHLICDRIQGYFGSLRRQWVIDLAHL